MFLNKPLEQLTRNELAKLQTSHLKTLLPRIYEKVSFYYNRMAAQNITPADIESVTDITKLPFTTKEDLVNNYPYGLLTMPVSGVTRFQAKAGTALGLTGQDIYHQIETVARSLVACNITKGSVIMLLSPAACLTIQQAAEGIGATVLVGNFSAMPEQLTAAADFGVTTLCGTKEDLQRFADALNKNPSLKPLLLLKSILIYSEEYPVSAHFTNQFSIPVYALYGPSAFAPASLAGECHFKQGLHVYEDSFIIEVIDASTQEILPPGEPGELVVTTLTYEAMPLLRFRCGINVSLDNHPCPCGRTSIRIKEIK